MLLLVPSGRHRRRDELLLSGHQNIIVISIYSSPMASQFCPSKPSQFLGGTTKLYGFVFELQRKNNWLKRRLKFVVSAELSKAFSISFGLDSQASALIATHLDFLPNIALDDTSSCMHSLFNKAFEVSLARE
jgi:hypothetical protein